MHPLSFEFMVLARLCSETPVKVRHVEISLFSPIVWYASLIRLGSLEKWLPSRTEGRDSL